MQFAEHTNTFPEDLVWSRGILQSAAFICLALVFFAGCAAPFSDLQSAKLAGKGKSEVTPSFSSVHFSDDEQTGHAQDHFGVQAAIGVSDRADLRLRYERIVMEKDGEDPFNVFALGPKIGVIKDVLALNLPVGFALRDNIDVSKTWQFHPTLLLMLLSGDLLELNTSAKALVPLNRDDSDVLIAFNVSPGISTDLEKWAIRPEVGLLLNPGEDGHYIHFSIGITVYP